MADIDFGQVTRRYKNSKDNFLKTPTLDTNKQLVMEFVDSCTVGMYGAKIGKYRAVKTLECLKNICGILPENKSFLNITKNDVKAILLAINEHTMWGDWQKYSILSVFRKFMTYIRTEHGYPEGYLDREKYVNSLPILGVALECKYKIPKPHKLKSINEIPTAEEVSYLISATDSYEDKNEATRDKAILGMLTEIGMRIGGLGKLRIGNVVFDEIGALVTITDKTMKNEPVRLIKSVPYLKKWISIHPLRDDPDAPLWINVRYGKRLEMDYHGMSKALSKAVETHNKLAGKKLPKITRRIHFHAFRYFAQTRDMLSGMPVSIQCLQRGWSPTSKQPQTYARVTTQQADQWLIEHSDLPANKKLI